jgi:Kdo2-lipid IVA lauroyltransferase/acyltransferase
MPSRSLLAPRYWPAWTVVGFFALVVRLPWPVQLAVGRGIGRLARRFARRRRTITAANLALCLPELDGGERARILRAHFESLGIGLVELAAAWWLRASRLPRNVRTEGLEHLETALARGKGALLLTAHFTTLEMGARLLDQFHPVMAVYRPHENPVLDRVIRNGRLRQSAGIIERGDLRGLLRALRSGAVVWFAPDQAYLGVRSVEVPFFGVPAPTNTATSRIAEASGAAILPFFVERLPGSRGYRIRIEPALAQFPGNDVRADAARVNAVLESGIRRVLPQYLWSHDRFKRFRRP